MVDEYVRATSSRDFIDLERGYNLTQFKAVIKEYIIFGDIQGPVTCLGFTDYKVYEKNSESYVLMMFPVSASNKEMKDYIDSQSLFLDNVRKEVGLIDERKRTYTSRKLIEHVEVFNVYSRVSAFVESGRYELSDPKDISADRALSYVGLSGKEKSIRAVANRIKKKRNLYNQQQFDLGALETEAKEKAEKW